MTISWDVRPNMKGTREGVHACPIPPKALGEGVRQKPVIADGKYTYTARRGCMPKPVIADGKYKLKPLQ